MAIEAVKEYFSRFGMADRIKEFDVSSATVDLAAEAVERFGAMSAAELGSILEADAVARRFVHERTGA